MEAKTANTLIEIAYMLTVHDVLTSEDYSSAEVKFKGLNEVTRTARLKLIHKK